MHIHILETGTPPAPLDTEYSSYPAMFRHLLSPLNGRFSFTDSNVNHPLPEINGFDGLLITGSPAGVYEGHDWIAPAEALVRASAEAGKPQIGICFGHQLMAQAFGGRVEKVAKGWGVGVHQYQLRANRDWMTNAQTNLSCTVSHQDQVVECPQGATNIAGSDFCPNGVLEYGQGPALSFQQHPEFSHDYAAALMRLRRGRIAGDLVDEGLASLNQKSDRELMGQWIVNFFLAHR